MSIIVSSPENTSAAEPAFPVSPGYTGATPTDDEGDVFVFPATAAQRRFWLLDQLVPHGNPALNMPMAVRLAGRLDVAALERSLDEILRRHEILRTTFHCEKGQLRQIIAPTGNVRLPRVDVRDFPASERAQVPGHLTAEEARQPFDLARGPVVRARLIGLGPEEHLLLITVHHIVSDGWSNGILLRELGSLYAAFVRGRPSPLQDLPIQFADFAQWQQDQAAEAGSDDPLDYWRKTLSGTLPVLNLPTDRPRRVVRGSASAGGVRLGSLPATLAPSLKALATREGVSGYMLYLAAFTVLLGRYGGGQEDLLVHTPSANRDRSELEVLIGPFVNPLLLRADLSGDPTFRELLGRTRRVVLGAFEHAGASFERLIEEIQPRRVQANFLHQASFMQAAQLPGLSLVPLDPPAASILGEWTMSVTEEAAGTKLSLAYDADLFDPSTVDRVLADYRQLLEAIVTPGALETAISQLRLPSFQPPAVGGLQADRWRLPTASVRWMDQHLRTDGTRQDGEFGQPREGTGLQVLDRHRQTPPVGVPGEIYLHGSPDAGGAALGTGDLGRLRADGRIEWLGRMDEQVFTHGLRVDTREIEAALQAHPHVVEAAVLWRSSGGAGGRRLTAYFQGDGAPAALVSPSQLRGFLRETLPEELIPAAFVAVERFPLTTDGRLDPAALPDPADQSVPPEEKYDAPYLTIHYQLIEIWRELLHVEVIGIRDDFFALGGNSLLAMRMLYQVEQACGKALLPATLFEQATVEHLADEILRQDRSDAAPDIVTVCGTGSKTPIFYLHGDLTGGGYYCMKLSRRLGPDQPFHALPPLGGSDARLHPSIEAMAAVHLKTIRSVRPQGPYVIGGFCLGGLIAQEMARQLEQQGEIVERLLIIDAEARSPRLTTFRRMAERLGRLRGWDADRQLYHFCRWHFLAARLQRWTGLDGPQQRAIFRARLGGVWRRLGDRLRPAKPDNALPPVEAAAGSGWFDPRWDVPLLFLWAVGGFVPGPYHGQTILLLSRDLVGGVRRDPVREWRKYTPRLTSRELAGSHLACITEHADALAETIRLCLESAEG